MENSAVLSIGSLITFQLYWNLINSSYEVLTQTAASFTKAGNFFLPSPLCSPSSPLLRFPALFRSPSLCLYSNYRRGSRVHFATAGLQAFYRSPSWNRLSLYWWYHINIVEKKDTQKSHFTRY